MKKKILAANDYFINDCLNENKIAKRIVSTVSTQFIINLFSI